LETRGARRDSEGQGGVAPDPVKKDLIKEQRKNKRGENRIRGESYGS